MSFFKHWLNKYKWSGELVLLLAIIGMSLFYNYIHVFQQGPYSIHMWRQADCLSITEGYYQNESPFYEPSMLYQTGGTGQCVAEFPLFYYINAKLWTWFGKSEMIFRLFTFSIFVLGLFYLYWLIVDVLNSRFWAMIITLFVFTSPILVFYANGFMVNVPALAFVFIGWYYWHKFYQSSFSDKDLLIVATMISIVGLLRISLLYTFAFAYISFGIEIFTAYRLGRQQQAIYQRKTKQGILLFTPLALVFLWVVYAKYYNSIHNSADVFLMTSRPIWKMSWTEIIDTSRMIFYNTNLPSLLFSFVGILFFLTSFLYLLMKTRHMGLLSKISFYSLAIGFILYVVLFFVNFKVHDYYLIELIPLMFFSFVLSLHFLLQNKSYSSSYRIKLSAVLVLCMSTYYCAAKQRIRYSTEDWLVLNSKFFYTDNEIGNWWYLHDHYTKHFKALKGINNKLKSIGIRQDDLILSLPDESPNITLYLMEHKGYSGYHYGELSTLEKINKAKDNGVKYLVVSEDEILNTQELREIVGLPIAVVDNVRVYKIKNTNP